MARYRAQTDGLIGSHYVRAGEVFEYEGPAPRWAIAEQGEKASAVEKAASVKSASKKAKAKK